jgi:hypothetical protein
MGRFTKLCFAASSAALEGKSVYDLSAVGGGYQLHWPLSSQLQLVSSVLRHGAVYFMAVCIFV